VELLPYRSFQERCTKYQALWRCSASATTGKSISSGFRSMTVASSRSSSITFNSRGKGNPPTWNGSPTPLSGRRTTVIVVSLQGLIENGKIYVLPGLDWLEDEFMEFPLGSTDDGLDALCNLVAITRPPSCLKKQEQDYKKNPSCWTTNGCSRDYPDWGKGPECSSRWGSGSRMFVKCFRNSGIYLTNRKLFGTWIE